MAHPNKFVSVNLNKSYGKPTTSPSSASNVRHHSYSSSSGGMVVLSRHRGGSLSSTLPKSSAPKLSVPPPLNLPSLRKESEKFGPHGSNLGSTARPGSSGIGSGPGTSIGWTKPAAFLPEKELAPRSAVLDGSAYMPPAARAPASSPTVEKAVFLKGDDFPSLKAATFIPKQKELKAGEEERVRSPLPMRPQMRSSRLVTSSAGDGDDRSGSEQSRKQQMQVQDRYFLGPLPIVNLAHTSNWADDERDTGLSLPDRDRDRGLQRLDFDEVGSVPFKDFRRGDLFGMNRDGRDVVNSWRGPPQSPPQLGFDRDRFRPKPPSAGGEMNSHLPYGESARGGLSDGTHDSRFPRRDLGFGGANFQTGKSFPAEGFPGRVNEQQNMHNGRFADPSNNRHRGDSFQNNIAPKVPFSAGSKGLSVNDPILNFSREKRLSSSSRKPYSLDAGFESTDPLSDDPIGEVNVKVFKRKKEVWKQTDFHDPVRVSFEAELERVQRIQEQERQQAMEEQARVMELARREQEERERLVREEEERRRLIEEEARVVAWRAEQERMEAARRVEEQKIAKEEEKSRIAIEEERRKEAARKKLLELEARMAKRQTDAPYKDDNITDEEVHVPVKERDVPKVASDVGDWEDGERMVEHITSTASSNSSNINRYFETGSCRIQPLRDENTSFMERGKHGNYWKRHTYDNGSSSVFHLQDQESDLYSSRRDTSSSGRPWTRKEDFGFPSASTRPSSKGGTSEYSSGPDDLHYPRGNRWNGGGDGDHFNRIDATEFFDNDKFGDGGWGSGRSRGSPNAPYTERSFQNEVDGGFPSFGRSRHSLRQPRVLPPPSISSMRHTSFRNEANSPGPTSFLDSQSRYHNAVRSGEIMRSGYDQRDQTPRVQKLLDSDVISSEQKEEKDSPRCDSQSSLSVSNPPSSPTHLSHDGFDEADDNPALETSVVEEHTFISDNEHIASEMEVGNTNTMGTSSTVSHEEDDEWAIEKNEEMNEQEDYDGEEDGYQEEEEAVHDGDGGETLEFNQEFNDPPSDSPNKTGETGQMVLDFNEAVDVSIGTVGGFEKTFRNDESGRGVQDDSVGDDNLQYYDSASTEGLVSESSKIMNKTEKALQELTLDPLPTPTSSYPESTKASSTQGTSIQHQITSGLSSPVPPTSTAQSTTWTVSAAENQAEAPIRLQFGLFSGPSLIPSPVPAIQIGSIQMPLHLPPPQPPFFQFGQLRYPSPLSQGILPLAPQTVSFIHPPPPASAQYSSSQNLGGSLHSQASQVPSYQNSAPDKVPSGVPEDQLSLVMKPLALSQGNINYKQQYELLNPLKGETVSRGQTGISSLGGDKTRNVSSYQNDRHIVNDVNVRKNYRPVSHSKEIQVYPGPSRILTEERTQIGSRATGIISNSRGRRFTYSARNASTRPLFPVPETSRTDSGGFQRRLQRSVRRTEFRVRENVDRREREVLESYSSVSQDGRPNLNGRVSGTSARYGVRKGGGPTKLTKTTIESENLNSGISGTDVAGSRGQVYKFSGRETLSKKRVSSLENLQAGEGSGKKNASSEEDAGAPLQSGVVCVFRQSGIEAPSDEDDFIEVRSKRQMLNDRREQREKEIRAKSKVIKAPRKHRAVPQSNADAYNFKKTATSFVGDATNSLRSDAVITDGRGFPSAEASPVFTTNMTSQTLPPIGTPAAEVDSDARSITLKSSQISCVPGTSSCATVIPVLPFEKKNTVLVNAPLLSGSWSNSDINQQVMVLTQSQLDDAMKPVLFDSHVTSSISIEPTKSSTSIIVQEKPFPPSACPLNSLLAGERIQFGAVTSPTILPPISRAVSNGIGPPGSSKEHSLTAINNDCTMFFDKERHTDESCTQLEDPEAEAEAAASAVAVAAITINDEIVGNRLGACSVSDSKIFTAADNTELTSGAGMTASKEVMSQSMAEESLSVALPADLSVDTPLPLWHPLPSPQGTSGPMLSHFSQPFHFPIVDVNSMFGGPFFAFGPHDEPGGTQAQPPRSTTLGSGQLGPWPHHSGVDSIYGPPTGFAGPYISPPGGIPGVQAPPHMVVYNHFAPVGQFGPVFMGTTYIPTGKQPDWKHNPVSSATGVSEGEVTNLNVASVPRNPPIMPSPLQHLAPGSPLVPMASPLPIFDMSPFQCQSSADIPFQARWSHVAAPSIHSVPLTMPPQQQQQQYQQHQHRVEGDMGSQFGRTVPADTSSTTNRFDDPSTTTDGDRGFSVSNDGAKQFPDELSLVQPPTVSTSSLQAVRPSYSSPSGASSIKGSNGSKGSSRSAAGSASEGGVSRDGGKIAGSSFKLHASQQQPAASAPQQLIHPTGYGDQRGGSSQKMGSGGEWHHRRGVNQGRGHGLGPDKSLGPSKMKQIYVAKPSSSGPAASTS